MSHQNPDIILKLTDIRVLSLPQIQIPQFKQLDQKPSIHMRRQRVLLLPGALLNRIQTGYVLLPVKSQFLIFLIDLPYLWRCPSIDHRQNIKINPSLPQPLGRFQYTEVCVISAGILPVGVMRCFDAVNGQAYQKMILRKKRKPLFIQCIAICLKRIGNRHIFRIILFFQPDALSVEVQPCQRGLSPLKSDGAGPFRKLQDLLHDMIQRFDAHDPIRRLTSLCHLVRIKTVLAPHITQP